MTANTMSDKEDIRGNKVHPPEWHSGELNESHSTVVLRI